MIILSAKHLSKAFNHIQAVNDINLEIEAGTLTAFLGPNGAGKSTTISMLTGLQRPSSGNIQFKNLDAIKNPLNYLKHIGIVFQNSILDQDLSVLENLKIRAKMYQGVSQNRIKTLMTLTGVTNFARQKYGQLSGGQKRRVDIARALLNQPEILFLDEPTTGLDIQTRQTIWGLLHHLQKTTGLTIFLTTHYLQEADHADAVFIMDHGKIIAQGSANHLKQRYAKNILVLKSKQTDILKQNISIPNIQLQIKAQTCTVPVSDPKTAIQILSTNQNLIENFEYQQGSMDDVFMALTGREIREHA